MLTLILNINGSERKTEAAADEPLLSVLRNRLGLTGTKYGCGEGQCGACTVLVGGRAVRSCLMPVEAVGEEKIITIEGLSHEGKLNPLQQSFLEEEAFQCAYCTSGMIMSAHALLSATPRPTDEQIIRHMNGNICRCGTYPRIVAAIHRAAEEKGKS